MYKRKNKKLNVVLDTTVLLGVILLIVGFLLEAVMFLTHPNQLFTTSPDFRGMSSVETLMSGTAIWAIALGFTLIILSAMVAWVVIKITTKNQKRRV